MGAPSRALVDDLDDETLNLLAELLAPRIVARLQTKAESKLLTCGEAAEKIGVCVETIRRAVRCGELPAGRVGRSPRIAVKDLDTWLAHGARNRHSDFSPSRGRRRVVPDESLAAAAAAISGT